ncbi:MAG: hypothetical protein GX225_06665 [Clostridiales bacterium]|nr:hypothetical protein [Clostridiales bacterium]
MLSNERIKLMTKLALYEENKGKKALSSTKYYQADYVSLNLINSAIIATIAFILIIGCIVLINLQNLVESIVSMDLIMVGRVLLISYILYMVVYLIISYIVYRVKFNTYKEEIKNYKQDLKDLYTMYKDEENAAAAMEDEVQADIQMAVMEED